MAHYECHICYERLDKCTCDKQAKPANAVKSDGGSSSYYQIPFPDGSTVEMKDIIKHGFSNDFDYGNVLKALKRIHEARKGKGKAGTSVEYDFNKIDFFLKEIKKDFGL